MGFLRPVRWREGMFLRPHHLQQHDLYLASREVGYIRAVEHYGWGLLALEVQGESLDNFVLAVNGLRAVLPDGTLVDVPGNARLLSRTIEKQQADSGQTLLVTLGVRGHDGRGPITGAETDGAGETRYTAVDEEVYDLDIGREPTPIERLEYDLRFFLGDEPAHGYQTLPLTELHFTGDPSKPIKMSPAFAPPSLVLSASPALLGSTRAVVERLATSLRDLGEFRGGEKVNELLLFQTLAGSFAVLSDMVRDGKVHPRRAYHELVRLAGTLYFRDETNRSFDEIPSYDHQQPGPVFEQLRALIHELSGVGFKRRFLRVPMERSGDLFQCGLPGDAKKSGVRLFLEVVSADPVAAVKARLMTAKVSSPARMETLKKFALPGIATEAQPGQPSELPPGQEGTYFRLKLEDGTEWSAHVMPGGELAALLLNAPETLKLQLIIVLPSG